MSDLESHGGEVEVLVNLILTLKVSQITQTLTIRITYDLTAGSLKEGMLFCVNSVFAS